MKLSLALFPHHLANVARRNNLTIPDMQILLYGSENPMFTQYGVGKYVQACRPTIIDSMKRLAQNGFVKIAVTSKPGVSRKYVLSGKGRSIITDFYILMNNL